MSVQAMAGAAIRNPPSKAAISNTHLHELEVNSRVVVQCMGASSGDKIGFTVSSSASRPLGVDGKQVKMIR
jgi:hypothetical protein